MTRDDFVAALMSVGAAVVRDEKWGVYRAPRESMLLAEGSDVLWDYVSHDPNIEWCYDPWSFNDDYITFRIPKEFNKNRRKICSMSIEKDLEQVSNDKIDAFLGFSNAHSDDGLR